MEESDLLAAIHAAPDDDGPRVVYADWLLAKSDPRGELIQVQCRLADTTIDPAQRRKLRAAENKLLEAHAKEWTGAIRELLGYADPHVVKIELDRGFVRKLRAPIDVLHKLDALFDLAPLIDELQVTPEPPWTEPTHLAKEDLASPLLAKLRSLGVGLPALGDEGAALIASCKYFATLEELVIGGTSWADVVGGGVALGPAGVEALAMSPHLRRLRTLRLDGNVLDDASVRMILEGAWKLESLNIANNACTGATFAAIASAPSAASLRRLALTNTHAVTPDEAAALASSPNLASLAFLDIEKCDLGPKGIAAFVEAFALGALEELIVASNGLGDAGGVALAKGTTLGKLRVLDVTKNRLGKKAIAAIASSPQLAGLTKILVNDRESKEARESLVTSKVLANAQIYYRGKLLAR